MLNALSNGTGKTLLQTAIVDQFVSTTTTTVTTTTTTATTTAKRLMTNQNSFNLKNNQKLSY